MGFFGPTKTELKAELKAHQNAREKTRIANKAIKRANANAANLKRYWTSVYEQQRKSESA
jgi:hypothetical protein